MGSRSLIVGLRGVGNGYEARINARRALLTTLLQTLGIGLPIIQAPMAGVSTPAMAAAVSNAGGLGSIGVGGLTKNV